MVHIGGLFSCPIPSTARWVKCTAWFVNCDSPHDLLESPVPDKVRPQVRPHCQSSWGESIGELHFSTMATPVATSPCRGKGDFCHGNSKFEAFIGGSVTLDHLRAVRDASHAILIEILHETRFRVGRLD